MPYYENVIVTVPVVAAEVHVRTSIVIPAIAPFGFVVLVIPEMFDIVNKYPLGYLSITIPEDPAPPDQTLLGVCL